MFKIGFSDILKTEMFFRTLVTPPTKTGRTNTKICLNRYHVYGTKIDKEITVPFKSHSSIIFKVLVCFFFSNPIFKCIQVQF